MDKIIESVLLGTNLAQGTLVSRSPTNTTTQHTEGISAAGRNAGC